MHFPTTTTTTALTLLTLLDPTLSIPSPQTTVTPGASTPWPVTTFTLHRAPAGRYHYSLSLSGPFTAGVGPAFATTCTGSTLQGKNKSAPCAKPEISTDLVYMDGGLVLFVRRLEKLGNGDMAVMAGNGTAAREGEELLGRFVVEAFSYGVIVG